MPNFLSKLYYSIINKRLLDYCITYGIISQNLLGFIPGNRTSDAHLIFYNLINKYCHENQSKLFGCFVDFSKAFDSIPRKNLLRKLLECGITGKVFDSTKHLYKEGKPFIKIGGTISQDIRVEKGVRQGCIMSPFLFNILMSDLPGKFNGNYNVNLDENKKISCVVWADDILMLSEREIGMKNMLEVLNEYCITNGLEINSEKTKCMFF